MSHRDRDAALAYRRKWYRQNLPKIADKLRRQDRARAHRVLKWVRNFKMAAGCADCGYNEHHAALEFDHVRGEKRINVCNAKSIAQAQAEIAKCEVVCSNCHRIRTFERMQERPCKPDIFAEIYEAVE